ncbi:hypothetical protein FOPG_05215 [Fusarium oxysporum f. sp. conglutinans race 2 54008]|uniref:Glycosyltransferase family 31 protein n=4 Tax=Fusarium oxysporum TaxID=5507 RepID=A0A8H6GVL7_FUSOX|nr:hypothetical protein FOXB_08319 [Fusarium oxysporum f. sp. conglutinans Fo5176]EXL81510.1 hypothetical protein FOPG_05215 [Fusarium oxysporum f. sp. conglutinans race 2 54008]KAF6524557.1 hypothetical protein HZS61_013056 [Fusarium oxysporum f. sp. conglutinans]KAH7222279.1 hypothetical protein BKA60DRAFT_453865 [Fusarium oxysporum]KAG6984763.1 hypothetical protein FocnCong_v006114 [Fusarium oxysporum f. sp. conglutinans]
MIMISSPPTIPRRVVQLLVLVVVVVLFFQTRWLHWPRTNRDTEIAIKGPVPEEQYLERLRQKIGLSDQTSWTAWKVRVSEQDSEYTSVTNIDTDFHSNQPRIIDTKTPERRNLVARQELSLPIVGGPKPGQIDASDFVFAISTSFDRVVRDDYAVAKDWARWMTGGNQHGNGASFLLVLDQGHYQQVKKLTEVLVSLGIDAHVTISEGQISTAKRYFNMMESVKKYSATLAQKGQMKKWYGILDEEIFLPNLSYLQERLFAYNSEKELYIGLPSERGDWAIGEGFMTTYGGGAIFLTRPAISKVTHLPCFDGVEDSPTSKKRWDGILQDCLAKHTKMKMHIIPSFYSPKDNDDYSSHLDSYETGIQPLALHDYGERHHLTPSQAHLVTDVCGEACFLQRYRFRDNWVLVNGYTITEYPDGIHLSDMPLSTAGKASSSRRSVIGPVKLKERDIDRKMLFWTGRRNVWKLMDSVTTAEGDVWQAYVKRGVIDEPALKKRWGEEVGDVKDSVIVLVWESAKRL